MRPIPPALVQLREEVDRSVGYWHRGRPVSVAEYAAMTDARRAETRWGGDPNLTRQLVEAEQAWTRTFRP